ncbi:uncharacterized protein LOC120765837 [Hirundo rustica]|uniref:uncharacterized protein LOC120765837 n=1 Tax=Hirundo rustica TaxID=43150 RepID=UPI00267415CB|nr:uncharacterized protein LOC120765837 [Hirundo rustica]
MNTLWLRIFHNLAYRNPISRIVLFVLPVVISVTQELESVSNQKNAEWPWSQAFIQYTGSMGNYSDIKDLNLSTVVMHENQIYERREWQKQKLWTLQGTIGEVVRVGCRMINGTNYEKAIQISVSTSPADYHREICDRLSKSDCWYNFTLVQTVNVICLWGRGNKGLTFKFKITTTPIATTKSTVTQAQTTPPKIEHKIYEIGPYVIRNTGQQQLLFNPEWSLKRIEVLMQTNISEIQPACSSFLRTSSEGWTTWLQKQVHFRGRMRRDLTGILGTGLGVLNGIDSEILMNKLATATNDLVKLRQPLQSSLLALGTSQWEISKILPKWKEAEDQDHKLIINALNIAQNNVSLALSCIQAQLWIQSIVALVVREGNEGTFPIEIRKIVWDNASNLERKLQSWWTLVNFTYDPTTEIATTFVLTIRNATIYNIHPIIALGLNHEKTVLYPSEHRAWARIMNEKWQTVNLESCVTREQQGFICETNMIDAQDICLDTEQNICHFEIHPDTSQKTMLVYIGLGCVCLRTACVSVEIDDNNVTLTTRNYSNFCICNFVRIVGCDFSYLAPVTSHQLIRSNYTMYHQLSPAPIGMNLTLVRQLMNHQDLTEILKEIQEKGQKTLVTVYHDVKEISKVLQRVNQDTNHHWWDALFGWSPTATGILNTLCHPIIVILTLVGISLVLSSAMLVWNWRMLKRIAALTSLAAAYGNAMRDTYRDGQAAQVDWERKKRQYC